MSHPLDSGTSSPAQPTIDPEPPATAADVIATTDRRTPKGGQLRSRIRDLGLTALNGAFLFLLAFGTWSLVRFGSLHDGVQYLKGRRLVVEPTAIHVAGGRDGEERTATLRVRNLSARPVEIMGANIQCTCVEVKGLPARLAANGGVDLPVKVHYRRQIGDVRQVVTLFSNADRLREVRIDITGQYVGER